MSMTNNRAAGPDAVPDPALAARSCLCRYLEQRKQQIPPVPVFDIALWLGFRIVTLRSVHDAVCALVSVEHRIIGVNGRHHPHRQRFSIEHELGHAVLGHHEAGSDLFGAEWLDRQADLFASELLMPEEFLAPAVANGAAHGMLAEKFDVSLAAMNVRLDILGGVT